jgi:hypothetical protein
MFFDSRDLDLMHAVPGTFALVPSRPMREALRRDYDAMAPMVLGAVPPFDDVISSVAALEKQLNTASKAKRTTHTAGTHE